jgi:eukaryotic-like serine/threonine-protein kinase
VAGQRRYRMGQALAAGGFGTVYRADLVMADGFTRPVAIKVLNDTDDAALEYAKRLRDEARMLGLVRHRAIVDPLGLMNLKGRWAVAMEFVPGVDLAQLIALGPMPTTAALAIVGECASALHVAYTSQGPGGRPLNLLHRDLKPGNIRVTPEGDVKILDFGAGRAEFETREAKTEAFTFGSMSYMAPERLDGFDSHAADVYSLGVVLFEMITGDEMGRSSAAPDRHAARLREVMDQLWRVTQGQSEDLVRLAGGLLAYDPAERPDAREVERFCTSLTRALDGPRLRDWAEQAVARSLPHVPKPRDAHLTGLEFTDSGQEIPAHRGRQVPEPAGTDKRSDGTARAAFGSGAATRPPPKLNDLFQSSVPSVARPLPQQPPPAHFPRTRPQPSQLRRAEEPVALRPTAKRVVLGVVGALALGATVAVAGHLLGDPPAPPIQQAPPATLSQPTVPLSLDMSGEVEVLEPDAEPIRSRSPKNAHRVEVATGHVSVSGYAHEVWLLSDRGRSQPGELPVGRYRVQARFSADEPLKNVGTVDVSAGATTQLSCSKVYKTCSTRE